MVIHAGGQNICGATIGVLCLESYFPKPPRHIKNTLSLPFPVLNEMINGVTIPDLLNNPSIELLEPFLGGAKRLECEGVRSSQNQHHLVLARITPRDLTFKSTGFLLS